MTTEPISDTLKNTASSAANKLGDAAKGLSEAANKVVDGVTRPIDKIADAITKPANAIEKIADAVSNPFNVRTGMFGVFVFFMKGALLALAVLVLLRFTFVDLLGTVAPIYRESQIQGISERDKERTEKIKRLELEALERDKIRALEMEKFRQEMEFKKLQLEKEKEARRRVEAEKENKQTLLAQLKKEYDIEVAKFDKESELAAAKNEKIAWSLVPISKIKISLQANRDFAYKESKATIYNASNNDIDKLYLKFDVTKCRVYPFYIRDCQYVTTFDYVYDSTILPNAKFLIDLDTLFADNGFVDNHPVYYIAQVRVDKIYALAPRYMWHSADPAKVTELESLIKAIDQSGPGFGVSDGATAAGGNNNAVINDNSRIWYNAELKEYRRLWDAMNK